jgi:hypothetical protein
MKIWTKSSKVKKNKKKNDVEYIKKIKIFLYVVVHIFIQLMRSVFRFKSAFGSKKLGIADTAKVIQDKIMNITQVVSVRENSE